MSSNFVKPGPGWPDNDVDIGKTYAAVQEVFAHLSALVFDFFWFKKKTTKYNDVYRHRQKYLAVPEVLLTGRTRSATH